MSDSKKCCKNANMLSRCRNAHEGDISEVAHIHLTAFDGFFLSQLGFKFLRTMYLAFLQSPTGLFVVYEEDSGRLAGFAVGNAKGYKNRKIALKFLPRLLVAAVPAMLRHPASVFRRLWARFRDSGDQLPILPGSAVLSSIGVLPSAQGTGAATSLLQAFEILARRQGAIQVYLSTDDIFNERALRFYDRAGYKLVGRFKQDGLRSMRLMSKKLIEKIHE